MDAKTYLTNLNHAKDFILKKVPVFPETAIVLGSGLGGFTEKFINGKKTEIPYAFIPHMPVPTSVGHAGNLTIGNFDEGCGQAAVFQGRIHHHDNANSFDVCFNTRLLCLLGVKTLIITNAAGGLNPSFKVGDLMLIENHDSTYLGQQNDPGLGFEGTDYAARKFYPQTYPYSLELIDQALQIAKAQSIRCYRGIYCFLPGPRFESAFEIKKLKQLGVDAVGMSTVPEVLAARHFVGPDINILGISVITNLGAGIENSEPNHLEVQEEGEKVVEKLARLIGEFC